MESKLGWSHWFDAYKMGAYARNRVPKKGGRPSPYERFYRREPSYKRMVPFGTVAYIQYKKTDKKSLDRSTEAQVIGYPDDTPGWVFKVPGNARPYATSHARFDKSRTAIDRALAGNGDYPAVSYERRKVLMACHWVVLTQIYGLQPSVIKLT